MKTVLSIIVILVVLGIIFSIIMARRTATGEAALKKMTHDERRFFDEKLRRIVPGDSYQEVLKQLGPPMRGDGSARPVWLGPNNDRKSQIAVYLDETGTVRKIRWMKIGTFVIEHGSH